MPFKPDNFIAYDHIPIPVFVFDINGLNRLVYQNTSAKELLDIKDDYSSLKDISEYFIDLPYEKIAESAEKGINRNITVHLKKGLPEIQRSFNVRFT